jgi:hypothetical protein
MGDMRPALEQALRALRAARVSALHPDSVSLYTAAITRAEAALVMSEIWAQPDQTYEYIGAKLAENMQKAMKNRARISVEAVRSALEQEEQEPMSQPGITKLQAEVKALRGLINLKSAEWRDKNIYPCGGEAYQNWAVTVYLPVPLSVADKSPESALARAIEEEEKNT